LVCCARKWGLIVSLTRSVHLGAIPGELRQKQEAVVYVDSVFIAETKPGVKIGKIIDLAKDAYKEKGYPCEWQHHHQGGPIGYETRDFIGISEENRRVMNLQAFAWNPSIVGNKSEDSFITSTSGTEMITMSNDWPLMDVKYKGNIYQRPDILVI